MSTLETEIAEIIERRFGCHSETAVRAAREIVESGAELQRLRNENSRLRAQLARAVEVMKDCAKAFEQFHDWSGSSDYECEHKAARAFITEMEASDE